MNETEMDLAFSTIAARIAPGATLLGHATLTGGVSAAVHVLDIATDEGRARYVVRRHGAAAWKQLPDGVTETEYRLLRAVHDAGLPVVEPLLLDTSGDVLPSPYFVMPFVEGSSEIPTPFVDSALRQMASFLAQLHSLDASSAALPELPEREDPKAGALELIESDPEHVSLRRAISTFDLTASSRALLHGDFWPGNVLWHGGSIAAVLDWEDAAFGPPASDVACCRAEINVLLGRGAADAFTESYRAASPDALSDLPLWDFYVSAAALASLSDWGLPPDVEENRRKRTSAFRDRAIATLLPK